MRAMCPRLTTPRLDPVPWAPHLRPMKLLVAALASLPASAVAATPLLVPTRDVVVDYIVHPRDHADLAVQVSVQAGGTHLRITSADLPTAFLVDRPAHQATILLPFLRLYATVGIGQYDPQETVLHGARFERHGRAMVAGYGCTEWTAASARGQAAACITDDGVILRGSATDAHGRIGGVQATTVQYGPLPGGLFRRPADYHDAGSLPVDGLGGNR